MKNFQQTPNQAKKQRHSMRKHKQSHSLLKPYMFQPTLKYGELLYRKQSPNAPYSPCYLGWGFYGYY
mgnify:CR=1 FL=1